MSQSSKNVDPYACAIRAKEEYLNRWKTVGHIPREISRHFYFIKRKGGFVNGTMISSNFVRHQYQLVD